MFNQVVTRPRRRVIKSVLVVGSAVIHAAVLGGLMVAAMWRVERVAIGTNAPDIALAGPRLPAGADSLPAGKQLTVEKPQVVKVKVTVVTQPEPPRPDVPTPAGPVGDPTNTTGGGGGGGTCRLATDPASELPLCNPDLPPCEDPPCSEDGDPPEPKEPVIEEEEVEEIIVSPAVGKGLRVAGDEQVFPPRPTQLEMVHDGKTTVRGTFQVCVDRAGAISGVRRLSSTGYPAYDDVLMKAMQGWQYRPYRLESPPGSGHWKPAPMCTVQMFVYRIRD